MNLSASSPLREIENLFETHGCLIYGESVNQIQHALQCATFAQQQGASESLIVAALLHDVGHMMHRDAAAALAAGNDDVHEMLGAKFLAKWFGPEVTQPVALHVQAKRYLCCREPQYNLHLSAISRKTLAIQGGVMTIEQAAAFETQPHWQEAVLLRRWDDLGKQESMETISWQDAMSMAVRCVRST